MKEKAHKPLGEGSRRNLLMLLLRKSNFVLIYEFKYGQNWKNWPSPLSLSLSLYKTFNSLFWLINDQFLWYYHQNCLIGSNFYKNYVSICCHIEITKCPWYLLIGEMILILSELKYILNWEPVSPNLFFRGYGILNHILQYSKKKKLCC